MLALRPFIANLVTSLIRWVLDVFEHENELLELFGSLFICFIVVFGLQVNSISSSRKNIIKCFCNLLYMLQWRVMNKLHFLPLTTLKILKCFGPWKWHIIIIYIDIFILGVLHTLFSFKKCVGMFWCAPKFLVRLKCESKVKTSEESGVGACSLACSIFGGRGACWSFGMGLGRVTSTYSFT